jgi:hypothetical protein
MPQQLIYTSALRGIVAGQSGYCTVARSVAMREALILQLEKFCYYQHLSLSGGQERPIFSCRVVDIRGTRFHVLSRIQDAGLDFTGRTNFIAHHLAFTPEEIRQFPTPPVILRDWPGWVKSWTKEPELIEDKDDKYWTELSALATTTNVPAKTWKDVTGDEVNGFGLLEARAGTSFRVDVRDDEIVLALIAESLALLEVRDTRPNFRTAAWNYTFTTSMQEQDNPVDFRWRCIHSDNPTANRFNTPDCPALSAVRVSPWTDKEKENEETAFARIGRQPPRFVEQPKNQHIREGEDAVFTAKAEGIPTPKYQWYECDQREKEIKPVEGQTSSMLALKNCKQGTTRYRVWATNGVGNDSQSVPVKLEVEPAEKPRPALKIATVVRTPTQKPQLGAWEEPEPASSDSAKYISVWWLIAILIAALVISGGAWWWKMKHRPPKLESGSNTVSASAGSGMPTPVPSPTPAAPTNQQTTTQLAEGNAALGDAKPQSERTAIASLPSEFGLPVGWMEMPIGNVSNPHADYITNANIHSRFDLSVAANGFFTNRDDIWFICKTNTETDFKATLSKIDLDSASRRSGIMIRESQKTDSHFLFLGTSPQNVIVSRRDGNTWSSENGEKTTPEKIIFLQFIHQKDNLVVPAYSFDDKTWKKFEDYSFLENTQMTVGFALCSGDSTNRVKVRFFLDVSPKIVSARNK